MQGGPSEEELQAGGILLLLQQGRADGGSSPAATAGLESPHGAAANGAGSDSEALGDGGEAAVRQVPAAAAWSLHGGQEGVNGSMPQPPSCSTLSSTLAPPSPPSQASPGERRDYD